jgi:hypothetical protein
MRVSYKGQDQDFKHRMAEIGYDDYDDKERTLLENTAELMEDRGWNIDICGCGYASCEVDDIDDFRSFMEDWKECKKIARNRK